jgi:hypothetical protein
MPQTIFCSFGSANRTFFGKVPAPLRKSFPSRPQRNASKNFWSVWVLQFVDHCSNNVCLVCLAKNKNQSKTKQNKTKQNKTKQNKTNLELAAKQKKNKTKQSKTKQNKPGARAAPRTHNLGN